MNGGAQLARLGDGLREAQRLLARHPEQARERLQDKVIAVTNAAKHDTANAVRRLDSLLEELRAGAGHTP